MRDSFIFYRSFYEALEDLPPKEFKAAALAIMQYALDNVEPTTKGVEKTVFAMAKPQIDRNNQKYINGLKGGRPHNQTETDGKPNDNQKITNQEPNDNQTETKQNQAITKTEKSKPNVNDNDMLLSNNINTTHVCAHAREDVSVSEFESAVGCEGWDKYPSGEAYVEVRDTLIELINGGQIELSDITHEIVGSMLNSMYIGRERREITDMAAYLTAILMRKSVQAH